MQIQMTGHGVAVSPALRELTRKKLRRIQSHVDKITSIHITFHVNKIRQIADANIKVPGSMINAQAESTDMYKTIDMLIHKLLAQLGKYKNKKDEHR